MVSDNVDKRTVWRGRADCGPFYVQDQPQNRSARIDPVSELDGQVDVPTLDVLVVEDNASSQRLFAGILESAGHRVRIAVNGLEAIRGFLCKQPDMVVIDLQMPILDGLLTTPMLRALTSRHIPIIATTARTGAIDRERFLAAGVDSFLAKPFEARTLHRLVAELWASVKASTPREDSMTTGLHESREFAAAAPPVDIPGALARLGGDDQLLGDLIRFFFEDALPLLERIHSGVACQNHDGARRAAHSLKGLAANFGAAPAVAALQAIETCESGSQAEIEALVPDVDREMARLAAALADFSDGKSAPRDARS
jgi:two-component system sensor histidine kinase/response regulator